MEQGRWLAKARNTDIFELVTVFLTVMHDALKDTVDKQEEGI